MVGFWVEQKRIKKIPEIENVCYNILKFEIVI